jgi:hypothetical protein
VQTVDKESNATTYICHSHDRDAHTRQSTEEMTESFPECDRIIYQTGHCPVFATMSLPPSLL